MGNRNHIVQIKQPIIVSRRQIQIVRSSRTKRPAFKHKKTIIIMAANNCNLGLFQQIKRKVYLTIATTHDVEQSASKN